MMGFENQSLEEVPQGSIVYTQTVVAKPFNVDVPVYKEVIYEKPVLVEKNYELPVLVPKDYEIPNIIHRYNRIEIDKPEYKEVKYEKPIITERQYEVPKIVYVDKIVEVPKVTITEELKVREVPIDVDRIVYKDKVVLNPIIKEYIVEVAKLKYCCQACGHEIL